MYSKAALNFLPSLARTRTTIVTTTNRTIRPLIIGHRSLASVATVPKDKVPSSDGDRVVVEEDGTGSPILVAKVGDILYAIEATCPHMGKSMEQGVILTDQGGPDPEIRCRFHNSRFNMKTGVCTKWVTGAFGFDSKLVSGVVQKVGGEKRDIQAYTVISNEDGSLTIDDGSTD